MCCVTNLYAHVCIKIGQLVLSGFGTGEEHLMLTTRMFQHMFPTIDVNTVSDMIATTFSLVGLCYS